LVLVALWCIAFSVLVTVRCIGLSDLAVVWHVGVLIVLAGVRSDVALKVLAGLRCKNGIRFRRTPLETEGKTGSLDDNVKSGHRTGKATKLWRCMVRAVTLQT
jgi:hypothetical protein